MYRQQQFSLKTTTHITFALLSISSLYLVGASSVAMARLWSFVTILLSCHNGRTLYPATVDTCPRGEAGPLLCAHSIMRTVYVRV